MKNKKYHTVVTVQKSYNLLEKSQKEEKSIPIIQIYNVHSQWIKKWQS